MISAESTRISFAGDGSTITFSYPYALTAGSIIIGYVFNKITGEEVIAGSTFTTGVPTSYIYDAQAKTATIKVNNLPPSNEYIIVLARSTTRSQECDLPDSYPYANIEKALDKATAEIQELSDKTTRTIAVPNGVTVANLQIPPPKPGYGFQWNEDGAGFSEIPLGAINEKVVDIHASLAESEKNANTAKSFMDVAQDSASTATAAAAAAKNAEVDAVTHATTAAQSERNAATSSTAAAVSASAAATALSTMTSILKFKGTVQTYSGLPATGNTIGDTYKVMTADPAHNIAPEEFVAWTGSKWTGVGGTSVTVSIDTVAHAISAVTDRNGNEISTTYAPIANPVLTGIPQAPTAVLGTNTTQLATTAFVNEMMQTLPAYTNLLQRQKTYKAGDIAYSAKLPSYMYLECVQEGITASTEPDLANVSTGGGTN